MQIPIIRSWIRLMATSRNVLPTPTAIFKNKQKGTKTQASPFVDEKRVQVFGGTGGDGCISFMHLCNNEMAGPDGGDGGNGGHVIFQATLDVRSLAHLQSIIRGQNGVRGHSLNCYGRNGEPVVVKVPFGTIFRNNNGEVVADLSSIDESLFLGARGGAGGKGNRFFATAVNQSPEIAEYGGEGESHVYNMALSVMAHVGLVGFPNAGKSTLLQAISRARPKVAPYPFTTLQPHLGMVLYSDDEQIAVADVPGLIEDAHKNRGLGISFLKHIERCVCLLYVIDMSSPDPFAQLQTLIRELDCYNPSLTQRAGIILANKMDLEEGRSKLQDFKDDIGEGFKVIPISAKYKLNLNELLSCIRILYDEQSAQSVHVTPDLTLETITSIEFVHPNFSPNQVVREIEKKSSVRSHNMAGCTHPSTAYKLTGKGPLNSIQKKTIAKRRCQNYGLARLRRFRKPVKSLVRRHSFPIVIHKLSRQSARGLRLQRAAFEGLQQSSGCLSNSQAGGLNVRPKNVATIGRNYELEFCVMGGVDFSFSTMANHDCLSAGNLGA